MKKEKKGFLLGMILLCLLCFAGCDSRTPQQENVNDRPLFLDIALSEVVLNEREEPINVVLPLIAREEIQSLEVAENAPIKQTGVLSDVQCFMEEQYKGWYLHSLILTLQSPKPEDSFTELPLLLNGEEVTYHFGEVTFVASESEASDSLYYSNVGFEYPSLKSLLFELKTEAAIELIDIRITAEEIILDETQKASYLKRYTANETVDVSIAVQADAMKYYCFDTIVVFQDESGEHRMQAPAPGRVSVMRVMKEYLDQQGEGT